MNQYRIVLVAADGQELSCGYLFSADDTSACASAERLMKSNPEAVAVQVFEAERMVCAYKRAA